MKSLWISKYFFIFEFALIPSPLITKILNRAEPTMVPIPTSACPPGLTKAISAIASSGAEDHIAIKVAPATSLDNFSLVDIPSRLTIKYLSVSTASK